LFGKRTGEEKAELFEIIGYPTDSFDEAVKVLLDA
jgi:hypothetical protein